MAVLHLEEPDRIPTFEWSINHRVRNALYPGTNEFDFVEKAGLDGVVVYADYEKQWLSDNTYKDEWGITYTITEEDYPTSVDFPIKEPVDIERLPIPDPCAPWRFTSLKEAVRQFKGEKAILFRLRDGYSLPRNLRGMSNLMMDFALNPDLIQRLVDISIDYYTRMAYCAMDIGADIFWTSDDYCDNRGPIMGPEYWRRFILPGLRKLVGAILKEGYFFIKHNDGNIYSILEDMLDAGISCIDPIDTDAGMELGKIKQDHGNRIAIKGGVPLSEVLVNGTHDDVVAAVRHCIATGGPGGGYILSSSSDITAAVTPENYRTMLETLRNNGTYPLKTFE
jgi:uroporphyrinogen decarboxylase